MSQADEILNNLTEEEMAMYSAGNGVDPHIVVNDDRTITVPDELKCVGVEYDHNIKTVTFDCPRYWGGHDLSKMTININYKRSDGQTGIYLAQNVTVDGTDESIIHFTWTFSKLVTLTKGALKFSICAYTFSDADGEERHWNSKPNSDMFVFEGLECSSTIEDENPDILKQLVSQMGDVDAALDNIIAIQESLIGGEDA